MAIYYGGWFDIYDDLKLKKRNVILGIKKWFVIYEFVLFRAHEILFLVFCGHEIELIK